MRGFVAALILLAALWRAAIDWQATIGEGYAYRLTSIGTALADAWPEQSARVIDAWRGTSIPYLWDPVGETLLALPLALVLALLAGMLWFTRRRRR